MSEPQEYCPHETLSNATLFELLGYKNYDPETGDFDRRELTKSYREMMRRFHPDKFMDLNNLQIASYIQQAYKLLTNEETFAEYLEEGSDAWTGKIRFFWNEDGTTSEYTGRTATRFDWAQANKVVNFLRTLDQTPTPEPEIITVDDDEDETDMPTADHHIKPEEDQGEPEGDEDQPNNPQRADTSQTSHNETISDSFYEDLSVNDVLDHRARYRKGGAPADLRFKVNLSSKQGKKLDGYWIRVNEMIEKYPEKLRDYLCMLQIKHKRKIPALIKANKDLINFL